MELNTLNNNLDSNEKTPINNTEAENLKLQDEIHKKLNSADAAIAELKELNNSMLPDLAALDQEIANLKAEIQDIEANKQASL